MGDKAQLFSGARGQIQYTKADGTTATLAIATDISVNVRSQLRPSYVIGELGPLSLEPLSIDVDCSIGRLVPVNAISNTADTFASPKAAAGSFQDGIALGLEDKLQEALSNGALEIVILDKAIGTKAEKTITKIVGARFTGRSMSVGTGDVAQERYNFVGIYDAADGNTATMNGKEGEADKVFSTNGYGPTNA